MCDSPRTGSARRTTPKWRERLKNDLGDLELHEVPVFQTNSVAFCRIVCLLSSI